jgi:hypothetical protein
METFLAGFVQQNLHLLWKNVSDGVAGEAAGNNISIGSIKIFFKHQQRSRRTSFLPVAVHYHVKDDLIIRPVLLVVVGEPIFGTDMDFDITGGLSLPEGDHRPAVVPAAAVIGDAGIDDTYRFTAFGNQVRAVADLFPEGDDLLFAYQIHFCSLINLNPSRLKYGTPRMTGEIAAKS